MRRFRLITVCCLLFAAACARQPAPRERLRVGYGTMPVYVLLYVAEDLGLLAQEGVELELTMFPSGRDALAAALEGKVDLATVYPTPLLHQIFAGRDPVAVSTLHRADAMTGVVARPGAGISAVEDLRGKRIGVTAGTSADYVLDILLAQANLNRSDLQLVQADQAELIKQLREEKLDGAVLWAQNLLVAQHVFPVSPTVLTSDAYTEISMLVGSRPRVLQLPTAIPKLLKALHRAERYIDQNPDAVRQAVTKRFPQLSNDDIDLLRRQARFEVGISNLALSMLRQEAGWLERQGRTLAPEAQLQSCLFPGYLQRVAPEAVTLLTEYSPAEKTP